MPLEDLKDESKHVKKDRSRLRYKKGRNNIRSRSRTRSPESAARRSSRSRGLQRKSDELSADDEAFYGSGSAYQIEPSLANTIENEDFTERLFDALADEEGREYWHQVYGQPIDDIPANREMSDDEYAAYVRRGMWERTHADQIEARRLQEAQERQTKESQRRLLEHETRWKQEQTALFVKQKLQRRWEQYLKTWAEMDIAKVNFTSFPWPTLSGTVTKLATTDVQTFLAYAGDVRTMAREELRRRWHPDRFQQKTQRYVVDEDKAKVLAGVTSVAQALNEIIAAEVG
ncbi:protein of unknown function [Taphrina deformans PYCC 5710]|uniref:Uncharacterized protein n=1 Tax=Taphrina deformans (strain PYCC 5710 / ATCC 11124 / CBS 356.35 / IMI 108563 / JCM 9778 / NBRC 8474) TaxID=1097556 RepID=R4XH89_TAPDE|nr:protein of unknown function [Taphrina deformans PYCC 5710]|eukprot:CCG85058.1 protein of unknown function [Taphrina deformans PYCC 5710]